LLKVRRAGFISFSVLGLVIIFVIGGAIILVSMCIDVVVGFFQRSEAGIFRKSTWITDEKLQLHRLANEGRGIGEWEGCTAPVPVTKTGEMLGVISIQDPHHPTLVPPAHFSPLSPVSPLSPMGTFSPFGPMTPTLKSPESPKKPPPMSPKNEAPPKSPVDEKNTGSIRSRSVRTSGSEIEEKGIEADGGKADSPV
jgi:hypothetical protein